MLQGEGGRERLGETEREGGACCVPDNRKTWIRPTYNNNNSTFIVANYSFLNNVFSNKSTNVYYTTLLLQHPVARVTSARRCQSKAVVPTS